ncbi:MAG: SDR family NAD(P)-dependent oxidoreductase [Hyphomicrobiaceae bacterium]
MSSTPPHFADWRRVMAVNADGVFLGCKHAMALLGQSTAPAIVNVSSVSGLVKVPTWQPGLEGRSGC